ncbi:hypothetical protein [Streptomyces sp. UG1]|uniref:hypothetical protein n=1 Tax=Streptomyces sp. UG1 TaxID=3417652 RepID=UPI003CF9F758
MQHGAYGFGGAQVVVNDLGGTIAGTGGGTTMADQAVKEIIDAGGQAAGNIRNAPFPELTPESIEALLAVHVKGAFYVTQPAFAAWASANYRQFPKGMDKVLADACPVVASYGGRDRGLKGAAAELESALGRLGVVHVHPRLRVAGVGPDPEASADAWRRIEAFFQPHLKRS